MRRVLVVDDEHDVADALAELLADEYAVTVAYDGHQALHLLTQGPVDAVVLDVMMPTMTGEAVMAELSRRGLRVPVLFASAARDLAERACRSGAQDFIAKPFDLEALERKLRRLVTTGGDQASTEPRDL